MASNSKKEKPFWRETNFCGEVVTVVLHLPVCQFDDRKSRLEHYNHVFHYSHRSKKSLPWKNRLFNNKILIVQKTKICESSFKARPVLISGSTSSSLGRGVYCRPPPQKKPFFRGRGLYHQISFSILEIRPWFKIWKLLKVSFGSIFDILVNTSRFGGK